MWESVVTPHEDFDNELERDATSSCRQTGCGGSTEREHGTDERINVFRRRSVIDDGRADGGAPADCRQRRRDAARLMQVGHDLGVQAIRVRASVAETNNVERYWAKQLTRAANMPANDTVFAMTRPIASAPYVFKVNQVFSARNPRERSGP